MSTLHGRIMSPNGTPILQSKHSRLRSKSLRDEAKMIKTLSQHYRERRSMFVLVSCSMVLIVFLCAIYRRYAFAIVWHCFHKNVAQVGTFKVEVPLLWWKGESDAYGTSVLIRASPATVSD